VAGRLDLFGGREHGVAVLVAGVDLRRRGGEQIRVAARREAGDILLGKSQGGAHFLLAQRRLLGLALRLDTDGDDVRIRGRVANRTGAGAQQQRYGGAEKEARHSEPLRFHINPTSPHHRLTRAMSAPSQQRISALSHLEQHPRRRATEHLSSRPPPRGSLRA